MYEMENKIHVPNHQPESYLINYLSSYHPYLLSFSLFSYRFLIYLGISGVYMIYSSSPIPIGSLT